MKKELSIGEVSHQTGVAVSALHFYERKGLIQSQRNGSNYRIYPRNVIRRITVIQIAQKAGIPLKEIAEALKDVPFENNISTKQWAKVSKHWQKKLDERIQLLSSLRDDLEDCIDCGCLSTDVCPIAKKKA